MSPTIKQIDETLDRLVACRVRLSWLRDADTTQGMSIRREGEDAVKIFDVDIFENAIKAQIARTVSEIRFHLGRLTAWGIDTSDQTVDGPIDLNR